MNFYHTALGSFAAAVQRWARPQKTGFNLKGVEWFEEEKKLRNEAAMEFCIMTQQDDKADTFLALP